MRQHRKLAMKLAKRNYTAYLMIRWLYRTLKFYSVVSKTTCRRWFGLAGASGEPLMIMVDPATIQRYSTLKTCKYADVGLLRGGDWDLDGMLIEDHRYYQSIRDLVSYKKCWQDTSLYRNLKDRFEKGEVAQGIRTKDDLERAGEKIFELYKSIEKNGYLCSRDVGGDDQHPLLNADDVAINIGRNGELLLVDGGHRIVICKLLGVSAIPVRVCVRHSEWVELKERLKGLASFNNNRNYQKIEHPDLMDIEYVHGDGRYEMIKHHLPDSPIKVLDIGSNWGYFCHKFEDDGYQCTAIENDPEHSYFLRRFRDVMCKDFNIVNESILNFNGADQYDVVLALNIFHHFIKYQESHEQLVDFLSGLKANMMFFQPHLTNEFDGMGYYKNYTNEEFVRFVMKHSRMTTSECIGRASDGRPIYKLT